MTDQPTTRLADYHSPAFEVKAAHLTFRLHPTATRVISKLQVTPLREAEDLVLHSKEMTILSLKIDGQPVEIDKVFPEREVIVIDWAGVPEHAFTLETEVEINPSENTALEGLYMSNGMYCTQCEAEGFRKITPYFDRPDVMAPYTVRIEGDQPVMLSNGNLVAKGDGWAEWQDPWPKPSYLFALVAGDLVSYDDTFTTASGRKVDLKIYVRPGDEGKCAYAMDALKRSMRWDEEVYGREYDLDLFMIVAVDDFNMGAMENKGLNIFNSKFVLASPETATDADFERIEGIIAHEYFHNWTGNRITCRDWFQLSLKEGLTVFRDQHFTGDQRSHAVKRIEDVQMLRRRQFQEDAGPLAHPVRPTEYVEINNFYTATIYEKGAEVIRMLHGLVGADAYRKALDLYFERHDGQACTIEDWLQVFQDSTGRDLSQFKRWYEQAGTPRVAVQEDWQDGTYTLTLSQTVPPTPGQAEKQPMVIPVDTALIGPDGTVLAEQVLELTEAQQSFAFTALPARPVASLLRHFSAPVLLDKPTDNAERAFLMRHDTDPFNRYEAGRAFALDLLVGMTRGGGVEDGFLDAMSAVFADNGLDPAFKALSLTLPGLDQVFGAVKSAGAVPDPMVCHDAVQRLDEALADRLSQDLRPAFEALAVPGPYSPDADAAGKRALRGRLLSLITRLEDGADTARAAYAQADNMTETVQALSLLIRKGQAADALADFHQTWHKDRLVTDKWFSLQAGATAPDQAVQVVEALTAHAEFDWQNPNRFRALLGVFAVGNLGGFHRADGEGYRLLADWLIRLDPVNPQTTARLAGAFETWRDFDEYRQAKARAQLNRIAGTPGLSKDTTEIVSRLL
ncbi:aminopeptidase N [Halovulum sp. GXIMD14793]